MVKRMLEVPEVEHPDSWVVFEVFGSSGLLAPSTINMNLAGRCSTGLAGLMYTFKNNSKSSSQWVTPKAVLNLSKSSKWFTKLPSILMVRSWNMDNSRDPAQDSWISRPIPITKLQLQSSYLSTLPNNCFTLLLSHFLVWNRRRNSSLNTNIRIRNPEFTRNEP